MTTGPFWWPLSGRKGANMDKALWEKAEMFMNEQKMIRKGERILLGISGGADSVCLARFFLSIREKYALTLYAVHVNHMLRNGEALRDQIFVENFCHKWEIPLFVVHRDIKKEREERKCSEEEAGREARYECFFQYAGEYSCDKIAVAHHQNDEAETILFRMIRGTGLEGLRGILPVNGKIIRPLLCLKKVEILGILSELSQSYVEDSTNAREDYSRNFLRHCVLPKMEEMNKKAADHICRLGRQTGELFDYLKPQIEYSYRKTVERRGTALFLGKESFDEMHPFLQKEVLRKMLFELSGHRRDISSIHVEKLLLLMEKKEGKRQDFPYGLLASKKAGGILLEKKSDLSGEEQKTMVPFFPDLSGGEWEGTIPGRKEKVKFSVFSRQNFQPVKKDCVKYFDYDRINCDVCLRTRAAGDYFIMDKQGRHKALARYFIDEKIPAGSRDEQLLLADGSHILWIIGGRISEAYKIMENTKTVLRVELVLTEEKKDGGVYDGR